MSKTSIRFSPEQIYHLEKMFGEVCSSGQSYAELQYRAGQRSVLSHIKSISNMEVQIVPVYRDLQRGG